ncbi:MMPL family transporter [Nocardia sp. NPDC020380]|uniref:MMPL family transporter n=1 Tax=Nocardia sp. NPDC020380 TaxID=3364309 RepID=UPI00379C7066
MFTRWGDLVFKLRYAVLGIVVAALLSLGAFGLGLNDHLSSSGWFAPDSQSSQASVILDNVYGRDHNSDVLLYYTAPDGETIDSPDVVQAVTNQLNNLPKQYPEITKINGAYWKTDTGQYIPSVAGSADKKHAFAALAIKGDNDTDQARNFRAVKNVFGLPGTGIKVEVAGLQPVAGALNDTMTDDQKRMEIIAIPVVAVLLFFIFGGIVAAALPLIIGGLTVIGANGIVMGITKFTEVNSFVGPVVSMIGLGLAIDYGLFIVSRFREEIAEGYDTRAAVRRSVMTAGRTVVFSATMIIAASAGMLLFPQGFLKSVAYGTMATVLLAALSALTILPAMLAILGRRVDALGLKWFRKTKTAEEVEHGLWGRTTAWVMKHPLKVAIPLTIGLLLLIIPVKNLEFGGISETYLPPDNPTRLAQQHFDETFPLRKTNPVQLVIITNNTKEIGPILNQANNDPKIAPLLAKGGQFGIPSKPPNNSNVWKSEATPVSDSAADEAVTLLREMKVPSDAQVMVTGQGALQKDSIDALIDKMPLMIGLVVLVTTILMFLTFGSLVLPIKAALMSALGLGSTLGILTWIFVDGHGSGLLNFTPQPIMSPVLVLIISVVYGLSIDYEVFLLSRMVEARAQGASTTEAVRAGTAQTGRIITAAALILLVVTGAFAFSDMVMMKYIAYGMVSALFIDATVLRMLLVPAIMKLLGDDCWWAPKWMKRIQQKIGLGEPILDDERPGGGEVVDLVKTTPITDPVTMQIPALPDGTTTKPSRKPRPARMVESPMEAPTERIVDATPAEPTPPAGPGAPSGPTSPAAPTTSSGRTPPAGSATSSGPTPPAGSATPSAANPPAPEPSPLAGLVSPPRPGHGITPSTSTGPTFGKSAPAADPADGSGNQRSDATPGKSGSPSTSGPATQFGSPASQSSYSATGGPLDSAGDDVAGGTPGPATGRPGDGPLGSPAGPTVEFGPTGSSSGSGFTTVSRLGTGGSADSAPDISFRPNPPVSGGAAGGIGSAHRPIGDFGSPAATSGVFGLKPPVSRGSTEGSARPETGSSAPASGGVKPSVRGAMPPVGESAAKFGGAQGGSDRPASDEDAVRGRDGSFAQRAGSTSQGGGVPSVSQPGEVPAPRPGEVTPSRLGDVSASRPSEVTASRLGDVSASRPSDVTASWLGDVTPSRPSDVSASRPSEAAAQADSQAGPVGADRVLPPSNMKVPPHPATRAQLYQPHPPEGQQAAPARPAEQQDAQRAPERQRPPEQPRPAAAEPSLESAATVEQPAQPEGEQDSKGGRSNIEQWMSDLRSSRRRPPVKDDDEGKHRGGEGRQVSVNELLRRQKRD